MDYLQHRLSPMNKQSETLTRILKRFAQDEDLHLLLMDVMDAIQRDPALTDEQMARELKGVLRVLHGFELFLQEEEDFEQRS